MDAHASTLGAVGLATAHLQLGQIGEGWDALNVPRPDVLENSQNSVFAYLINILPDVTVNEPDPDWIELRGHVTIVD